MKTIEEYSFKSGNIPINIEIQKKDDEYVPIYDLDISIISQTTSIILERVRKELIEKVNLGMGEIKDLNKSNVVEEKFTKYITILIDKYFPDAEEDTREFLTTYLKMKSFSLGNLELLMSDSKLEEIVVNQSDEPAWVYHKDHGWLKTTVELKDEEEIKHYASVMGRKVGRQITKLNPLLDANLESGDRVNATLNPVSSEGNTITIRKFSEDPWTITKFIDNGTITAEAAALIWLSIQYEMSAMISGGTASGKTSALNVFAGFFPPNQRIISIEDTREVRLPSFLHWVPLSTVMANPEGKGEVNMGNLLVNSLRMRPDRILVGEVRRKEETETLFEAIHTGHSVYATFHANNAEETVERLTNPPINVPKVMLPSISLIVVQFRNRRTGNRRTFQIAEILEDGTPNVIMQFDQDKGRLVKVNKSKRLYEKIELFTGMGRDEINDELEEKQNVLEYLQEHDIRSVDGVGKVIAEYYTDKENLMKHVKKGKRL